jgi:hypothetical protein
MAIFCPMCRKKHPKRECPLNSIEECAICELNHATSSCPSLPGLKVVFQGTGKDMEQLYLMGSRNTNFHHVATVEPSNQFKLLMGSNLVRIPSWIVSSIDAQQKQLPSNVPPN